MPTLQDVKDYLGIDYMDAATDRRLTQIISVANKYLEGSLGTGFPTEDPRVKELALIVIADLYDNHTLNEKVAGNIRRLVEDFSLQIRLDMRTAGEVV
ncbi:head-tail connector protein [Proteiniclasticum sp. BAD-10]|uniref:Head-tail connector protein n=1 Tax=Proteiniclasticum sediminis TaxID=2804028 RepID=A0A941CN08_9CLOT|nr:head-tail connector protein [Proteiniclasticum sediminis]MBR0575686.1 head-tail connector protein [Proteiniclasticum sediminis]